MILEILSFIFTVLGFTVVIGAIVIGGMELTEKIQKANTARREHRERQIELLARIADNLAKLKP